MFTSSDNTNLDPMVEKLKNLVVETLKVFYEKEKYLVENNSSERNMVFNFGWLMKEIIKLNPRCK